MAVGAARRQPGSFGEMERLKITRPRIQRNPAAIHLSSAGRCSDNRDQLYPAVAVADDERETSFLCRCCGGRMTIIERFARGAAPQTPFTAAWSDTS
jgi:hypothetical protein